MLFDMGVYLISALTHLLGPTKKVTGAAKVSVPNRPPIYSDDIFTEFLQGYRRGEPNFHAHESEFTGTVPTVVEVYDNTFTLIEWPNECLGCVIANSVSFVLPPPGARLVLCGEKGTIAFGMVGSGSRLSVATLDKESEYYVLGLGVSGPGGPENVGWYHFPPDAFPAWRYTAGSTQHLHDCIVNDTEPLASIEWGCHVAEIMIKSFESAEKGQALDLVTTFRQTLT